MAMTIVSRCIRCGACEMECSQRAITMGDQMFLIDEAKCTQCEGTGHQPSCVEVCPVEAIFPVGSSDAAEAEAEVQRRRRPRAPSPPPPSEPLRREDGALGGLIRPVWNMVEGVLGVVPGGKLALSLLSPLVGLLGLKRD